MEIEAIKEFLSNSIIIDWIAPIVTTLIATVLVSLIKIVINDEKNKKEIKLANGIIVDTIRPFIIQQIPITKEIVECIIEDIKREKGIKDKDIYSYEDIKNKLIFDIASTRFLKENDKNRHFKLINKIFDNENDSIVYEQENELESTPQKRIIIDSEFLWVYIIALSLMITFLETKEIYRIVVLCLLAVALGSVLKYIIRIIKNNQN